MSKTQTIKVLIVDDHELIRSGIKKLLGEVPGIKVVGEAESGEQLLVVARQLVPDVVIMDVKMPGIGGLEATRRLLRMDPDVKVIALTSCDHDSIPSRILQAGAMGYLTKDCGFDEMLLTIKKVCAGQRYISPHIAQQLALRHITDEKSSPFEVLSDREFQIMMMITRGEKVMDISDQLHLSPKTINSHRYRIFEKLNLSNDVELTHLAIKHGMLDEMLYKHVLGDNAE